MMAPARTSFWVHVANACREYDGNLGVMMLGTTFALFAMMAIGILVHWQVG